LEAKTTIQSEIAKKNIPIIWTTKKKGPTHTLHHKKEALNMIKSLAG